MNIPAQSLRLCMSYAAQAEHYADKNNISATKIVLQESECPMYNV